LEVIATVSGQAYHFWRDSGPSFTWNGPETLAFTFPNPLGSPSLIQSQFGSQGNFELVGNIPDADDPSFPWSGPTYFSVGAFGPSSLIQSNFGNPGNLEVVTIGAGGGGYDLVHFWRDSGPSFTWSNGDIAETGI
jgi:hypothetical protein